jgi:hypothetical protein
VPQRNTARGRLRLAAGSCLRRAAPVAGTGVYRRSLFILTLAGFHSVDKPSAPLIFLSYVAKTQVVLVDDLTGDPADTTVKFALDRTEYEIDLSDENAAEMRDELLGMLRLRGR